MKPILSGLLLFTALFLPIDILIKKETLGLWSSSIKYTLFGNEEQFIDPISSTSFLESLHTDIFFIMMILLTLSAIFARLTKGQSLSIWIINVLLLSALLSLVTLALSFYVNSIFINFYVVTFFVWHILAFYMSSYSLWKLNFV